METQDLTTEEAAARLGVTRRRVLFLCGHAGLPGARLHGRDWLIPLSAVEHYERERRPAHRPRKDRAVQEAGVD